MRWIAGVIAASGVMLLAGCQQPVQVQIYPDLYAVGEVRSPLATPVVDEVVRRNPRKVIVWTCRNTPPRKVLQFNVELQARSQAQIGGNFLDEGCPA